MLKINMYIKVEKPSQEAIDAFYKRLNTESCYVPMIPNWYPDNTNIPINIPKSPIINQGWQCPRCNKINAPFVTQCTCNSNFDINKVYC